MFETEPLICKCLLYCVMEFYPGVLLLKAEDGLVMVEFLILTQSGQSYRSHENYKPMWHDIPHATKYSHLCNFGVLHACWHITF